MKKILLKVLPFVAVLVVMLGSVWIAKVIHSPAKNVFHVNTSPDEHGIIRTVRIFDNVTSVMVIDYKKHYHKKKIPNGEYRYNAETTELTLTQPLPFDKNVIHIEGTVSAPERFCLSDFDGSSDSLLVILNGREAIENYEWRYNQTSHILSFRNDISPERDGSFLIMYHNENNAVHSFGNWIEKDSDRIAEVQSHWLHRTQNIPLIINKDRSRISNRRLSREVGFRIDLPKGDATIISETISDTEKQISVMRWYDDWGIAAECKTSPFPTDESSDCIITLGQQRVTKQETSGTRTTPNGSTEPVTLILYQWTDRGTYYQISCEPDKATAAEKVIERI